MAPADDAGQVPAIRELDQAAADVRDLTHDQALELTGRIRDLLETAYPLVVEAYRGRAWIALDYGSWQTYCECEFAGQRMVRLEAVQRGQIAAALAEDMPTRAIASALGVGHATVARDLQVSQVGHLAERVTGRDGKSYPRARAARPRRPLPTVAGGIAADLERIAARLRSIETDDRYRTHRAGITDTLRPGAGRVREVLDRLIDDGDQDPGPRALRVGTRPGVSKWSRAVQSVSKRVVEAELTDDELRELLGAATFLADYCRGMLITRRQHLPLDDGES